MSFIKKTTKILIKKDRYKLILFVNVLSKHIVISKGIIRHTKNKASLLEMILSFKVKSLIINKKLIIKQTKTIKEYLSIS